MTEAPTCPACNFIHESDTAIAVGRFRPGGPRGYRSPLGSLVRATRNEAAVDTCVARIARASDPPRKAAPHD